ATGSVLFSFHKKGQMVFDIAKNKGLSEDTLLEIGLEHGIEDVALDDESLVVTCPVENYLVLKEDFDKEGLMVVTNDLTMIPGNLVSVSGDNAKKLLSMIEGLEDLDDVQNVYTNMDIDEKELEELMA